MNQTIILSTKTLKRILFIAAIGALLAVGLHWFEGPQTQQSTHVQSTAAARGAMEMPKGTKMTMPEGTQEATAGMKEHPGVTAVRYTMSEEAKRLAQVQTQEVKREKAGRVLRTVGMVFASETREATLTARIAGRLDEVFIDFTGVRVKKGDPMVTIWSPTLIQSEVELFVSMRSRDPETGSPEVVRGAKEKLMQYGMTQEQIDRIIANKKPEEYITLKAPISGIVMKKMAVLGQFVKEGQDMFVINDLSHVWVKLDAYEPDVPWIRYGQEVTFTTPSFPGKTFKGTVIFIDPVLDMPTRTVKVRVDVPNPDYALKPHMFVNAEIRSEVDAHGHVVKSEWAGKYICPFHPEEVSDSPGMCPKSKQPLQPAASYGYSGVKNPELPIVIPQSAILFTGERSLVYVEVPNQPQPTYEQRDVTLGPRVGNDYVVYSGLKVGERVVVKGNFQIDSSVQILGEPSMMNPAHPSGTSSPEMPSSHTAPKPHSSRAAVGQGRAATQEKAPAAAHQSPSSQGKQER